LPLHLLLMTMKILITGASGMVGKALAEKLALKGVELLQLSSSEKGGENIIRWNTQQGIIDPLPVAEIKGVVHLAGAGIVDEKWTSARKKVILDSRVKASEFLFEAFSKANVFPDFYISASGTGIYPDNLTVPMNESFASAQNFVADVCKEWERAASLFEGKSRLYVMRFGVILGKNGFLKEILKPAKFYAGAVLGSGKQLVPWIHINDVVNVIMKAIEGELPQGTYNLVAPSQNSMEEVTKKAAAMINRPVILPKVPAFVVKLFFGERSSLLLGSQWVVPQNLLDNHYAFEFVDMDSALTHLLKK